VLCPGFEWGSCDAELEDLLSHAEIFSGQLSQHRNKDVSRITVNTKILCWSRDSAVGIATGYGLDDQGVGV
jgi:hypothetical protein